MNDQTEQLDGVRLAVLANRFQSISRSMMNTLYRTGRSGLINTARDCSCCVLTANGEMVGMAESIPMHVVSGPDVSAEWMKRFHPELDNGDAFLHNSPYHGNSHAADHVIMVPVMDRDGVHRFTIFAKAHQADCGAASPTTYAAAARDVYEEGAPIFPCVKVQEDYRDLMDVIRMCELRIRVPDQWRGDYLALLGAARIGQRQMLELGEELGWDVLERFSAQWLDYSEQRMIDAIRAMPSGRATAETVHDPFPGVPDGVPLKATVAVDSEQATIDVDVRDNPDCLPCGLNLTEATSIAAVMIGLFNSIDPDVPPNAGSFRRIAIHLRENCCVGIPRHPASCAVATSNLLDRVANCVQRAMTEIGDDIGMAEFGLAMPPAVAVISGHDPRRGGAPFVNQMILGMTGGAASPTADGWLTAKNAGTGGVPQQDSIELDELRFPLHFVSQRLIPDSEGPGRFRGAPGAYMEYGPVGCSLDAMYLSDGTVHPALGARGGGEGSHADQFRRTRSGELERLDACARIELADGETVVSMSCGGGGYGSPTERDPELVRHDVAERIVTRARAREVYAVALADDGAVDASATEALRATRDGAAAPAEAAS